MAEQSLYRSTRTQVDRITAADGSTSIRKTALGPNGAARTEHEIAILERLSGIPGVPVVVGAPDGPAYFVADSQGVPLAELIAAAGPAPATALDLPELLELAAALATLLARVHHRGVVHKDINPVNILLAGPDRSPMLIDFELASGFVDERPSFAHANSIVGTPAYLAPEQTGRTGQGIDHRTDLYSLGITLYELSTGRTPFGGDDPLPLLHDHLAREPVAAREVNPALPASWSDVLAKLLEKEPGRRYQSAEGLAHDLRQIGEQPGGASFRLGQVDFPLRLTAGSRVIGRRAEVDALTAAVDQAAAGAATGLLVTGPSGVGKTALLDQLRPIVTAAGGWLIGGTYEPRSSDHTVDALTRAMRALGRLLLAEPEADLARRRARLQAVLGDRGPLIAIAVPELGTLLDVEPWVPTGDPMEVQLRLARAALDILRTIASPARPLVLVLDDVQWASTFPLNLVEATLTDPGMSGLLVVLAYPEESLHPADPLPTLLANWARAGVRLPRLRLGDLPGPDLAELLAEMLRLEPAEAGRLAAAVGARTGGNPGDTIELLNALRAEGTLTLGGTGWTWDAVTIRRHIGAADVGARLAARIRRLPAATGEILEVLAGLEGEVDLKLLATATGLTSARLQDGLGPAVEDGLLVPATGGVTGAGTVRFRHERVQQAVDAGLSAPDRRSRQLAAARRLAAVDRYPAMAAQQYLPVHDQLTDPAEGRRVAHLLHREAVRQRSTNSEVAERFLAAAGALLAGPAVDPQLQRTVRIDRHAALHSLGRFADVDDLYRSIEQDSPDPLPLVGTACLQMASLTGRDRAPEALALGLELLGRLGLAIPTAAQMAVQVEQGLVDLDRWVEDDDQAGDLARPEITDPRVRGIAEVLRVVTTAAFFGDRPVMGWLMVQSFRLWTEHGPDRALVGPFSHAALANIELRENYRNGYQVVKRILAVGAARGYEPETALARLVHGASALPWCRPLEEAAAETRAARDGLLLAGDLSTAVYTYLTSQSLMLDLAPTLDAYLPTVETGLELADRTGNSYVGAAMLPHRRLVRALRGETDPLSTSTTGASDDPDRSGSGVENPTEKANSHVCQALLAALLDDQPELLRQTGLVLPLLPVYSGTGMISLVYLLRALALAGAAGAARTATAADQPALIAELDTRRQWLAARAGDAPANFAHLLALVDAERAWAVDDFRSAVASFDGAIHQVGQRRPWHRALILERASQFYRAYGHEHAAGALLTQARNAYATWGASAKVELLHRDHPFLRSTGGPAPAEGSSLLGVTADAVDLLSVLKASQALSRETGIDQLRARVVEVVTEMTGATGVTVLLRNDEDSEWLLPPGAGQAGANQAGAAGRLPRSALRYAERTREPLLVADAVRDDRFADDPYLAGARCCSLLVVPILSQGALRVLLVLENRLQPSVFSADRLDAILLIAGQLAVSFDNARAQVQREQEADRRQRLLDTLQRREKLLETLLAIQRDISHRVPLPKVLDAVTSGASTMLDGAFVALVLLDPAGDGQARIPSVSGARSAADRDELVLTLATEAIAADHLVARPGRAGGEIGGDGPTGGLIAAPVHASGEIIGSLVTSGSDRAEQQDERQDLLRAFAEQVSLALNDANTLEAIREASFDSLTGLASRQLFLDRLKRGLEQGVAAETELTILFIDLDRFKAVNDSLGHSAGDDLLIEVAERLRGCIRETDTGARLGGDEFAVLLEGTHGETAGLSAAERIRAALEEPFRIAGQDVFVSASVGVAHGAAADLAADDLLEQADLAMYRAKKAGSQRALVFEPQMHAEARERLRVQSDLRRALTAGEFRLQFQPLLALGPDRPVGVDGRLEVEGQLEVGGQLGTARPIGVEALVRWPHPERGMVSPDVFIPVAEETGAIVELGHWVLVESCRQVAGWRETVWPELELSINVSGRQLLDGQLAADIAVVLGETGLPASALTLELTETVLMDDPGNILLRLSELKQLGVKLAIDDFGTGYSSLSYLRRFPVDKLKIDKSFIDNIETVAQDLAIVRTVVELARILHLQTTAEGIETQTQSDLLTAVGCEVGQGYLFARPLDTAAVPEYLAQHAQHARPARHSVPGPRSGSEGDDVAVQDAVPQGGAEQVGGPGTSP